MRETLREWPYAFRSGGVAIRYIGIVLAIIVFVILFVWQNIEVMKIKMEYRKGLRMEQQMERRNDRLRYEIERLRKMDLIERYAETRGMRQAGPEDIEVIEAVKKK